MEFVVFESHISELLVFFDIDRPRVGLNAWVVHVHETDGLLDHLGEYKDLDDHRYACSQICLQTIFALVSQLELVPKLVTILELPKHSHFL